MSGDEKLRLIVRSRREADALRAAHMAEFELRDMEARHEEVFTYTDATLRHSGLTADGIRRWKETCAESARAVVAKREEVKALLRATGCES